MDEFTSYTPEAKAGILFIRALSDEDVLAASRDQSSETHARIRSFMPPGTNPWWISTVSATEAFDRNLIDYEEFDGLCD